VRENMPPAARRLVEGSSGAGLPEKRQDVPDNKPQQTKENYNIRRVLDESDGDGRIICFLLNMRLFIFPVFIHVPQVYTPDAIGGYMHLRD
jgi:hypothetical protein